MANRDIENVSDKEIFEEMSNESRELFKRAIIEALDSKIYKTLEETKDIEIPTPSKRHKVQMNRLFCEHVGGSFLPFPEEDE